MNPRWKRIEEVFDAVADLPKSERAAILDRECASDPDLRAEIESLLAHDDADETAEAAEVAAMLERVAAGVLGNAGPAAPKQIGPYRVIREIASGGMGVLYEAVREDQFQKRVAVKVVKRGMDTASILRRFHRERQILAGLSHPNITALLDGGTTADGLPYFVMEYVEGQPIAAYCDREKLSTRARLELFRVVCAAVHYAHQNLVVHRDLKPDNILVTRDGVPKLLDFGIAKVLNVGVTAAAGDMTVAVRVMTPEYASPEQIRGEPITTSADVYCLGVVLYQLMTGHRPYRLRTWTPQEIADAICQQDPEKPSTAITREEQVAGNEGNPVMLTPSAVSATRDGHLDQLRKRLRGDVDNIVLKALQKEPGRRYASVEQFSEDIRRHLEGLPVIARKDTLRYRSGKFVVRHKAGVLAAAAVVVALVGGIITTTRQAGIAAMERSKAERRFADVRQLANSVLFELHDAIADLPGSTAARELLLKMSREYLDRLAADAEGDRTLARELALAYEKMSKVQGAIGQANLGKTRAALESLRKAVVIREKLAATNKVDLVDQQRLAGVYIELSSMLAVSGDHPDSLEYARKAAAIYEWVAAALPGNIDARVDIARAHTNLAGALFRAGDLVAALDSRKKSLAIFQEAAAANPTDQVHQRNLALGHKYLGAAQLGLEQYSEAMKNYQAALAIDETLSALNHTPQSRLDISFDLSDMGYLNLQQKNLAAALDCYMRAVAIREQLRQADPNDSNVQDRLAFAHARVAATLMELRREAEAFEHYRKVLALRERLAREDPDSAYKRDALADAYASFGAALAAAHENGRRAGSNRSEAIFWLQKAAEAGNQKAKTDLRNLGVGK